MVVNRRPQLVVAWQLGRMVRLCSDLDWAAKQISAMVVGHCFLREGLCLGIVREVLKFQYLKVLITRVPPHP